MLYPFVYTLVFFCTLCAVIITVFVLQTNRLASSSSTNDSPMVRQGLPPATVVTQNGYMLQDSADVFVGYDPGDQRCQQFLLERSIQRIEQRRRRRLLDPQEEFSFEAVDYFVERSNQAIDRLLGFDLDNVIHKEGDSKKRRLSEMLSAFDDPLDSDQESHIRRRLQEDFFQDVKRKEVRDVILPLVFDDVISPNGKQVSDQSVDSTSASSTPTLQSGYQTYQFYDVEVIQYKYSNNTPSDNGDVIVSSTSTEEDILKAQWFKFIEMDRISIPSDSTATVDSIEFASFMPCVAFTEIPKEHAIENEIAFDVLDSNEGALEGSPTSTTSTVGLAVEDGTHLSNTKNEGADGQSVSTPRERLLMPEDASDVLMEFLSHHHQLRHLIEEDVDFSETSSDGRTNQDTIQNVAALLDALRRRVNVNQHPTPKSSSDLIFMPPLIPNDPDFKSQWSLKTIGAPQAWGEWTGPSERSHDAGSIVAVLDTGCDLEHRDLRDKFWRNEDEICDNGIDDDGNGYIDDCYGYNFNGKSANLTEQKVHGSPVSGAIAAQTDNNYGIAGVCWSCKIMCGRVGVNGFNTGNFAEALNYALGWGVKVINYSGNGGYSKIQDEAIQSALTHDAIVVTCAGNSACDVDGKKPCADMGYPGKLGLSNIINVGASGYDNQTASYSNIGLKGVHIFAPSGILLPHPIGFKIVYGTSFAAPLVTGSTALVRSRFPDLSAAQIKKAIISTCSRDVEFDGKAQCPGIINIPEALKSAEQMSTSSNSYSS